MNDNRLKDNDFLLGLNFDTATDQQKIALLNRIIDNEMEKPEIEVDMALVDECMDFISDLENNRFHKTDEELTAGLQAILFRANRKEESVRTSKKSKTFGYYVRYGTVFAAVLLLLAAVFAVAAKFNIGDDNLTDDSFTTIPGEQKPEKIIVMKGGTETASYASVEQLLHGEGLDIHYPAKLPQSIWLECVDLKNYDEDKLDITFIFNSSNLKFNVHSYDPMKDNTPMGEQFVNLTIDSYTFLLHRLSDGAYQATCTIDDYVYCVTCADYDTLLLILENLKAIEY